MAIYTQHEALGKYNEDYSLIRTVIEGDRAIKSAKEAYVPRLSGQDDDEYKAYIGRAAFENYSARVMDGLVGLAFSKEPIITVPKAMDKLVEDISLADLSLNDFATDLVREVLTVGRCGLLIDLPNMDTTKLTKAQVELLNVRPYSKIYQTESILNWRYKLVNNVQVIDMVILSESVDNWITDYESKSETIYRVLILREGVYTQEIFKETSKDKYTVEETIVPMLNGKTMGFIPFISLTPDKLTLTPAKPPILDLVNVNLSHFKLLTDFYHGAHFTALPTANFFVGNVDSTTTIKLGASTANVFNDPSGSASYLEFQGAGLSTLSTEKDVLVTRMAALGARFLADDKKVAETAESQETRSSGERAILISAVTTISHGITRMLEIMAQWMNITGEINYELNKDYNLSEISPAFLKELWNGSQIGKVTDRMIYDALVGGEVVDSTTYSFEDYQTDMEAQESKMSFKPVANV